MFKLSMNMYLMAYFTLHIHLLSSSNVVKQKAINFSKFFCKITVDHVDHVSCQVFCSILLRLILRWLWYKGSKSHTVFKIYIQWILNSPWSEFILYWGAMVFRLLKLSKIIRLVQFNCHVNLFGCLEKIVF